MGEILQYQFKPLGVGAKNGSKIIKDGDFEFSNFDSNLAVDKNEHSKRIRNERIKSRENDFSISPVVLEHRGMRAQKEKEEETLIQGEIEKRFSKLESEAKERGYQAGFAKGREDVLNELSEAVAQKIDELSVFVDSVRGQYSQIVEQQRLEMYTIIRNLSKWVILRELSDDGEYLRRLFEKLLNELKTSSNILVQVSEKDFAQMPEVLNVVSQKIGEMKNVRIEIDPDIENCGMIISSENGIISGTLEQQLSAIDKLFNGVGVVSE